MSKGRCALAQHSSSIARLIASIARGDQDVDREIRTKCPQGGEQGWLAEQHPGLDTGDRRRERDPGVAIGEHLADPLKVGTIAAVPAGQPGR